MFFYYFRQVVSYVPFALCWLCFFYLLALFKAPEIIEDVLDPDRTWTRRILLTLLFFGFFFALASGGMNIVFKSDALQYWDKDIRNLLIVAPILGGAFMGAAQLMGIGADMATKSRNERYKNAHKVGHS